MKINLRNSIVAVCIAGLFSVISACQTIDPIMSDQNITVYFPDGQKWNPYFDDPEHMSIYRKKMQEKKRLETGKTSGNLSTSVPVVFFLQGTGGGDKRAKKWAKWFSKQGVGSVIISSAAMRNLKKLSKVNSNTLAADVQIAIDAVKEHPHVDLEHYAVMGFSKGGLGALQAARHLNEDVTPPDFIFALYPSSRGNCPSSLNAKTEVHIFYGELDQTGDYKNNRDKCKRVVANHNNGAFHSLKDTYHGYDGKWSGIPKSKLYYRIEPNAKAVEETKIKILEAMNKKWRLKG